MIGFWLAIGCLCVAVGIIAYQLGRIHGEDAAYAETHRLWAVAEKERRP